MLLVSVPLLVVLAALLTVQASSSLTSSAKDQGGGLARGVSLHVEDWFAERQEQVAVVADQASGQLGSPAVARLLSGVQNSAHDYQLVEVIDLAGRVIASSRTGISFPATGQDWFADGQCGQAGDNVTGTTRRADPVDHRRAGSRT